MMDPQFQADIDAVQRIGAVPTILDVVCRTTGMGFAAIARVTDGRWIACGVKDQIGFGLEPGGELQVDTTICSVVRRTAQSVVIDHVAEDRTYGTHPTPALYGFQSYISAPIILPDGSVFGTLCAIDPKPNRLATPETTGMFTLFAELIAFHIDGVRRLEASEARLLDERRTAELREQFIAVLGHDLRNPLASIGAGARVLARTPRDAREATVLGLIQGSVVRMAGLIDNVLDFARGRLGGGLSLNRDDAEPLEPVLQQVVAELRAMAPDRIIATEFALARPVRCDRARIAQLFSNLLGNALTHGAADTPVEVRASSDGTGFTLSVKNRGETIAPAALEQLFQPFSRGAMRPGQEGLGLGLYIASEIARAHGGTLEVASDAAETCFTLRIPAG